MQLILIRHAQSYNNALKDVSQRQQDPHLTELGWEQAYLLAQHLANATDGYADEPYGYDITHLYASPMIRALQTASVIADALQIRPEVWVDIHELGGIFLEDEFGVAHGFPGMTRAEMQAHYPHYHIEARVTEGGWWPSEKGMETEDDGGLRAERVAEALRARARENARIALVTHGGFMDRLIKCLLGQTPQPPITFLHYNTAFSRVDFLSPDDIWVHYLNRIDHLPSHLRSS